MSILPEERVRLEGSQFFWDYFSITASQMVACCLSALVLILTARLLQPEGYGKLSLFLMIAGFVTALFLNWPNAAIIRFGKEEFIKSGQIEEVFWARIFLYLFTFLISLILIFIFREPLAKYVGLGLNSIFLLGFFVLSSSLVDLCGYFLQATAKMKTFGFTYILSQLVTLTLLSMFIFGFWRVSVVKIIILKVISQICVISFSIFRLDKKNIFPVSFSLVRLIEILQYSWSLIILGIAAFIVNWIDVIVIRKMMTVKDVGVYSLAYQGMIFLNLLITSTIALLFPLITSLKTINRLDLIRRYMDNLLPLAVFAWSIFMSLVILLSSYFIPLLFGFSFNKAVDSFMILALGLSFSSIGIFYAGIINTFSLLPKFVLANLVYAGVNCLGDFILVPRLGIIGAAISTTSSIAISVILYIRIVNGCKILLPNLKRYYVFFCCLPSVASFLLFYNSSAYTLLRIIFFVAITVLMVMSFKKIKFLTAKDINIIEQIKIPFLIRRGLLKILLPLVSNNLEE